ncbi:hypothetical protein L6R52_07750 [Myxococcota bacterium]|nr:hypothetical protein [Myxococcota bacterium]
MSTLLQRPRSTSGDVATSDVVDLPGTVSSAWVRAEEGSRSAPQERLAVHTFLAAASSGRALAELRLREQLRDVRLELARLRERVVVGTARRVRGACAVYAATDGHDGVVYYVVVAEHDAAATAQAVDAEDELVTIFGPGALEVRVRAHQGRSHDQAVPTGAKLLWEAD